MAEDVVGVVEAFYRLRGGDHEWLAGVLEALRPSLDRGLGLLAYLFDARVAPRLDIAHLATLGIDEPSVSQLREILAAMAGPDERIRRILAWKGGCGTASEVMGDLFASMPHFDRLARGTRMRDFFGMTALDSGGLGCVINAPLPAPGRTDAGMRRRYARVSAHLAASLRLRRALPGLAAATDAAAGEGVEAILAPSGRLHHAAGPARAAPARSSLNEGVRRREKARGALRRLRPDEALAEWSALVAGRWSLLDHVESDGRRVIIARRNEAGAPPLPLLTLGQAQAVGFALLGHSNKLIAYELGLRESTVAMRLGRACRTLGVRSRVELIDKVRRILDRAR